ncbi:hypothetical protein BD289DRAFT_445061 [Coniella lustricola]|uniref:Uncharacterized protein n=1 Tax=Coniella lustricola TaxID=2025994 RepID=A0A2T2ZVA3_9PEZI|nr:hypothetical protein BD289DRAFT_445061 [Coniella lustricola]
MTRTRTGRRHDAPCVAVRCGAVRCGDARCRRTSTVGCIQSMGSGVEGEPLGGESRKEKWFVVGVGGAQARGRFRVGVKEEGR